MNNWGIVSTDENVECEQKVSQGFWRTLEKDNKASAIKHLIIHQETINFTYFWSQIVQELEKMVFSN